jgi:ketosteroid isomerase-like protein
MLISETDVAAIKDLFRDATRALIDGDLDAWVTYWAEDGVMMPPNHPSVRGHAQLIEYVRANMANLAYFEQPNWTIEGRDGLAVVSSDMQWTFKQAGSDSPIGPPVMGKQVVVLLKDTRGSWKAQTVIYNTNGAP